MTTRVLLLTLCAAWTPACGGADEGELPQRVLVIVIDATHAAHLGSYGGPPGLTPRLDALAARGRRFQRAVSNTTWTLASTTSLLGGQLQEHHGVVTNRHRVPAEQLLLAERFAAAGWTTAAFVEMAYAAPAYGLDQGFQTFRYYSILSGVHPFKLPLEAGAWMDAHAGSRWFAYVHLRRPHSPYDPHPLALRRAEGDCPLADGSRDELLAHADSKVTAPLGAEEQAHLEHLYRGNLAAADDQLAELLDRAAADPGLLVVLTSDHGEALGEHGHYGHGYRLEAECIDIPLLFAGPGVLPGVDDGPACTVDLAPTLGALCRLPAAEAVQDGESLVARLRGQGRPAARPLLLSARYVTDRLPAQGVLDGRFKLILEADDSLRLHDLQSDPGETVDVAALQPDVVARLLPLARARRAEGAHLAHTGAGDVPVDTAELRALGYLR